MIEKYHCPKCNIDVPKYKGISLAGAWLLGFWYMLYYYFVKKEICPVCGHVFTKEEKRSEK
jgi:rubredoxin